MMMNDTEATPGKMLLNFGKMFTGSAGLWEGARFLIAEVPLNRKEVKKILPLGLWPSDPATGMFFIVDYVKTSFTFPYKEAALLINVNTPLGRGVHCCWMVVDDDTALIYGRELLGYPKKFGKFTFQEEGNHVSASVSRRGVTVLSMEGEKGAPQNPPPAVFDRKTFNTGGPGSFFMFSPIWMFRPREVIKESYSAQVTVKISQTHFDPIWKLVDGDAFAGRFVVSDIPGTHYNIMVGAAGLVYSARTFYLRFR